MKKIWIYLSALLCLMFAAAGCTAEEVILEDAAVIQQQIESQGWSEGDDIEDVSVQDESEMLLEDKCEPVEDDVEQEESIEEFAEEEDLIDGTQEAYIDEDGSYTSCDEVALYIHTYGKLPKNFITKQEAQDLGWDSKKGNLHEVAPGMSIGGNRFGNYEQILPDGNYKECDINYTGGYRGDERIVYSDDGDIYYTDDHYATFTQLYSSEE